MELGSWITIRFGLTLVLIVWTMPSADAFREREKQENGDNVKILRRALSGISSENDSERAATKATLLRSGQEAIPPLLELLKALTPDIDVCPPGSNLPCTTLIFAETATHRRTRTDVILLLAEIRAVDAIPLLIKTMGLEDSIGFGFRYSGPEKKALVKIGVLALPELLDSLRQAEERRRGITQNEGRGPSYLEIEVRIVDVLGDIGDDQELPALEQLKERTSNPIFVAAIKEAIDKIDKIKNKSKDKSLTTIDEMKGRRHWPAIRLETASRRGPSKTPPFPSRARDKLVKAGLSENLIVQTVNSQPGRYSRNVLGRQAHLPFGELRSVSQKWPRGGRFA